MEEENNVLFVRGTAKDTNFTAADDVWDDTALIKAYDKAINLAKDKVAKRIGMEFVCTPENSKPQVQKKSNQTKANQKWTVGSPCRAIYANDGQEYEAIVTNVYEKSKTCRVTFVGYGNTEIVELSTLRESHGLKSQIEQNKNCQVVDESLESSQATHAGLDAPEVNGSLGERMDFENEHQSMPKNVFNSGSTFNSSYGIMPPAPPLPPQLMSKLPDNDADALSSMLMSWYISGFHTGYYHGIKQARHLEEKRKK
ncbi:survival motor neuron protein [Venturia canescens]|uniref:survival motor neuron protein n=1 Tax=Venturia canescens TaxID=32260 RepID=UPI001C9C3410|nr:survival motor neuron protein [Venturia canescens]